MVKLFFGKFLFLILLLAVSPLLATSREAISPEMQTRLNNALLDAAEEGNEVLIYGHLQTGAQINTKSANGETPLHIAARNGDERTVQILLDKGADINALDNNGFTPLDLASRNNRAEIIRLLADLTAPRELVRQGNIDIVKKLITSGANINVANPYKQTEILIVDTKPKSTFMEDEQLIKAVQLENLADVERLLAQGGNANARTGLGDTALDIAARNGNTEIVRLLLNKKANPNIRNEGWTPLFDAIKGGHIEMANLLIEAGANVNLYTLGSQPTTPLHLAVRIGRADATRLLLNAGANVDAMDRRGDTALSLAKQYNHTEIVNLIRNIKNKQLFDAVRTSNASDIINVVNFGAQINARDQEGRTPLFIAATLGKRDIVDLLLGMPGINLDLPDKLDNTPLIAAIYANQPLIVQKLIQARASVDAINTMFDTPLHVAAYKGNPTIVRALLAAGASPSARGSVNQTPRMVAAKMLQKDRGNPQLREIVELLGTQRQAEEDPYRD